jgi:hypothetical protein
MHDQEFVRAVTHLKSRLPLIVLCNMHKVVGALQVNLHEGAGGGQAI